LLPGGGLVSKLFSQRSKGEPPDHGRNLWDLILELAESGERTNNFERIVKATADILVRLIYATAVPVGAAGAVLILGSNEQLQRLGRGLLASAGVAIVAATARAARRWTRRRSSTGEPDPPSENPG